MEPHDGLGEESCVDLGTAFKVDALKAQARDLARGSTEESYAHVGERFAGSPAPGHPEQRSLGGYQLLQSVEVGSCEVLENGSIKLR